MLLLFVGQNIFRNIIFKEEKELEMDFKQKSEIPSDGTIGMDNTHFDVIRAELYWRVAIFLVSVSMTYLS